MTVQGFAKPEVERSLLGALILDPERVAETKERISGDLFSIAAHRRVFRALSALDDGGAPIDPVTVVEWLRQDRDTSVNAPKKGWFVFVGDLMTEATTATFVSHHCRVLLETGMVKKLAEALTKGAVDATRVHAGVGTETADFVDEIERQIHTVAEASLAGAEVVEVANVATKTRDEVLDGKRTAGLSTGISDLDDLLLGMRSDELILVAARPAMGKTSLAVQVSINAARSGASILFLSLEMSRRELVERLFANLGGVNSASIRSRHLVDTERDSVRDATQQLRRMSIGLVEGSATTVQRLRGLARRRRRREGLDLIVVDYLQLMSDPGRKDRVQEVSAISRDLKALARELHVPVIAVSQLSRAGDGGRPRLSHLRDSGALEQDADVVLMLWSDDEYSPLHCSVEKNRHGRTGLIRLAFIREHFKVAGLARDIVGA